MLNYPFITYLSTSVVKESFELVKIFTIFAMLIFLNKYSIGNMKSLLLIIISFSVFFQSMAQPTAFINDPDARLKEAKGYFQKKEYSLAYPLFRELSKDLQKNISSNFPITVQEIEFYDIVCGLMQNEDVAVTRAENYIFLSKNEARVEGMSFYLGEYFFRQQNFKEALENYKMTDFSNIDTDQLSSFQFHKGYSYFFWMIMCRQNHSYIP